MSVASRYVMLLLPLLGGCSEVELERWEELDYERLQELLARPDGVVGEEAPIIRDEFLKVADELDLTSNVRGLLSPLVDDPRGLEPGPVQPRAATGTNLFVRVACPGRDLDDPDTEFRSGRLRIESPGRLLDAAKNWRIDEDFLLVAEDCRIGPAVLNGASPGYVDRTGSVIALDLRFEFVYDDGPEKTMQLQSLFAVDYYSALVRYKGSVYAVNIEFSTQNTLLIRGQDGGWACDLDDLTAPCERLIME